MIPLRKGVQYEVMKKRGKGDHLIRMKNSPQARKKWSALGEDMIERLLMFTRKGKVHHMMTSMTDALRYPGVRNGRSLRPPTGN